MNETEKKNINLKLGDIVQFKFKNTTNKEDENIFYIEYIDNTKLKLINVKTEEKIQLSYEDITEEVIEEIIILSSSDEEGYINQNDYKIGYWLEIYFKTEVSTIITAEITNIEEDCLELKTYPDNDIIYIDFAYSGLPEFITKIEKINSPIQQIYNESEATLLGDIDEIEKPEIEYTADNETIVSIPEGFVEPENIREKLQKIYRNANIIFGEELEEFTNMVEIPEENRKFSVDMQINDLTDQLLSVIPNYKRTDAVLAEINLLIKRFIELREQFSLFDNNGNITNINIKGHLYKPLLENLKNIVKHATVGGEKSPPTTYDDSSNYLKWIIPVVSQIKKVYNIENTDNIDTNSYDIGNNLEEQLKIQTSYYKNNYFGDTNKYYNYYQELEKFIVPIEKPQEDIRSSSIIYNVEILKNIDTIVGTLNDLYSSVVIDNNLKKKKYVIQKYNLTQKKENIPKIGGDKITIKSIMIMPEPVMFYSKINLPQTDIMLKSQLNLNNLYLFRLFKEKSIKTYVIQNLENEINYGQQENKEIVPLFSNITEFLLDEEQLNINNDNKDLWNKYLNVILPNTRTLINILFKTNILKNKLSFNEIVKILEPYMVYSNDITYQQFKTIRFIIKENIKNFNENLNKKSISFSTLINTKYLIQNSVLVKNEIEKLLISKTTNTTYTGQLYNDFLDIYNTNKEKLTSSELLLNINLYDNFSLFIDLIIFNLLELIITPNKLINLFEKSDSGNNIELEDIKAKTEQDCIKRVLAKKYNSISELQKDNNEEVLFFDKEFDDTNYELLKDYKIKLKEMLPEKFLDFLTEILIQKYKYTKNDAVILSKNLILGKKTVEEGHYAIVELKPKYNSIYKNSKIQEQKEETDKDDNFGFKNLYYRRIKNNWIKDKTIDEYAFINTNTLFCNYNENCIKTNSKICDTTDLYKEKLKKISNDKISKEFDKRITLTFQELKETILNNIETQRLYIKKIKRINEIQFFKTDYFSIEIGKLLNSNNNTVIQSPYVNLRNLILSLEDFTKKQNDINRFVKQFCREPIKDNNEDIHFLYCIKTNTKLFPVSLNSLAIKYLQYLNLENGQELYLQYLYKICDEYGVQDGSSIVDKYSGFTLRKIDDVNTDFYDENENGGHSVDIIIGDYLANENKKIQKIFDNEITQMVYNICLTLINSMEIEEYQDIEEFVIRISLEMINNKEFLLEENKYKKIIEKTKKEKKNIPPYEIYKNQTIIKYVACVFFIYIQSSIPFLVTKNVANCVRSFNGFPLEGGIENTSGLEYIACILNKYKSSIPPWNSIQKISVSELVKQMMVSIQNLINRNDIQRLIVEKNTYLLENPHLIIPKTININNWTSFLPPVVKYTVIKQLSNIPNEFKNRLLDLFKNGNKEQIDYIHTIYTKNIQYSYGIIELINSIVENKKLLLKTSNRIPFLENACCNENSTGLEKKQVIPILYFIKEDNNIEIFINNIKKNSLLINDINILTKPSLLFHLEKTGIFFPVIETGFFEENIYLAFIHYCNFDNLKPINEELKIVCSQKPEIWNKKWSLEEKINNLKEIKKDYKPENFKILMNIINKKNLITTNITEHITNEEGSLNKGVFNGQLNILNDVLLNLEFCNSKIIEEPLRRLLQPIINSYNPNIFYTENTEHIYNLNNYLYKTNEIMTNEILKFIKINGISLNTRDFDKIQNFILNVNVWDLDSVEETNYSLEITGVKKSLITGDYGLKIITNYIKNSVYNLTKIYPNKILNNSNKSKSPKHWDLNVEDFIKIDNYIEAQFNFNTNNNNIKTLLEIFLVNISDLYLFISNIPTITPVNGVYSLFDKKTIYLLFNYCWYSVLYEYICTTDNEDIIKLSVQEYKNKKREQNKENLDASLQFNSILKNSDETMNEENTILNSIQELEIISGRTKQLKEDLSSLLVQFLNVEMNNKKMVDLSYSSMSKDIYNSKKAEKNKILSFFDNLSDDQRNVEKIQQKHKIDKYNLGQQKTLFKYDKNGQNVETFLDLITADNILDTTQILDVNENYDENNDNYDIDEDEDDIEHNEAQNPYDIIDDENGYTMLDELDENFNDGIFYNEDKDDDDFNNY